MPSSLSVPERHNRPYGIFAFLVFSPDGRHALSGEYTLPNEDTLVRWWSLDNGKELARFAGHQQLIWSVAVSPDGKSALSGSADQTVRVWHFPK